MILVFDPNADSGAAVVIPSEIRIDAGDGQPARRPLSRHTSTDRAEQAPTVSRDPRRPLLGAGTIVRIGTRTCRDEDHRP